MMPTFHDRQELAQKFADDVVRMRRCLHAVGKHVDDDDLVYAWADYSDGLCACWLTLPEEDDDLLVILSKHLPPLSMSSRVTIQDTRDGSGERMLELPDVLLTKLGWAVGDMLSITRTESGNLTLQPVK
jgi:hypothetical protein